MPRRQSTTATKRNRRSTIDIFNGEFDPSRSSNEQTDDANVLVQVKKRVTRSSTYTNIEVVPDKQSMRLSAPSSATSVQSAPEARRTGSRRKSTRASPRLSLLFNKLEGLNELQGSLLSLRTTLEERSPNRAQGGELREDDEDQDEDEEQEKKPTASEKYPCLREDNLPEITGTRDEVHGENAENRLGNSNRTEREVLIGDLKQLQSSEEEATFDGRLGSVVHDDESPWLGQGCPMHSTEGIEVKSPRSDTSNSGVLDKVVESLPIPTPPHTSKEPISRSCGDGSPPCSSDGHSKSPEMHPPNNGSNCVQEATTGGSVELTREDNHGALHPADSVEGFLPSRPPATEQTQDQSEETGPVLETTTTTSMSTAAQTEIALGNLCREGSENDSEASTSPHSLSSAKRKRREHEKKGSEKENGGGSELGEPQEGTASGEADENKKRASEEIRLAVEDNSSEVAAFVPASTSSAVAATSSPVHEGSCQEKAPIGTPVAAETTLAPEIPSREACEATENLTSLVSSSSFSSSSQPLIPSWSLSPPPQPLPSCPSPSSPSALQPLASALDLRTKPEESKLLSSEENQAVGAQVPALENTPAASPVAATTAAPAAAAATIAVPSAAFSLLRHEQGQHGCRHPFRRNPLLAVVEQSRKRTSGPSGSLPVPASAGHIAVAEGVGGPPPGSTSGSSSSSSSSLSAETVFTPTASGTSTKGPSSKSTPCALPAAASSAPPTCLLSSPSQPSPLAPSPMRAPLFASGGEGKRPRALAESNKNPTAAATTATAQKRQAPKSSGDVSATTPASKAKKSPAATLASESRKQRGGGGGGGGGEGAKDHAGSSALSATTITSCSSSSTPGELVDQLSRQLEALQEAKQRAVQSEDFLEAAHAKQDIADISAQLKKAQETAAPPPPSKAVSPDTAGELEIARKEAAFGASRKDMGSGDTGEGAFGLSEGPKRNPFARLLRKPNN